MTRVLLALLLLVLSAPTVALADDVSPGDSGFIVTGDEAISPSGNSSMSTSAGSEAQITVVEEPACLGGDELCAEPVFCEDGSRMMLIWYFAPDGEVVGHSNSCPVEAGQPIASPQVTPGMVLQAFRRIPLPASELMVQPPGGRTLVNFDTNFYTEGGEFTRTVTLLGRRVELRIWPASYGWRFGDGETRQTTEPGDAYPHLEITHRYLRKGRVRPSVDTTYAAEFRVGTGPWRPVSGTVTIPGSPEGLRVVTARPVLVGYQG